MIQKIVILLLCVSGLTTAYAQDRTARQERIAARVERHQILPKENNVFLTMATGLTGYNQIVATAKVEYSRQIKGNFYWGASFAAHLNLGSPISYDWDGRGPDPYRNTVDQNIYKLNAMVYYRAPVIASRLYFRVGAGVGGGYHRIKSVRGQENLGDRILPYFNIEAAWILRVTRGFEIKLSPLIIMVPSEFSFSPVKLGTPTDVTPLLSDVGFSLTMGWRF